jgi:hypothetical protein
MRRFAHRRRNWQLECLEPRVVLDSTVVFNEIMYNPASTGESLEWIELHNQMAVDMDLSKWSVENGVDFTFAEGTIIPGGGYLVLAADPAALADATGFSSALGPWVGDLDNNGEEIRLVDRNDRLLDALDYRDEGSWPVGADGSGASLAKINPDSATGPAENWTASPQIGGTIGERNFAASGAPATSHMLVELADTWTYNGSGTDLGTAWREPGYSTAGWSTGGALLYAGTGQLGNPTPTLVTGVTATASTQFTSDGRVAMNTVNGSGLNGNLHSNSVGSMWLSNGTLASPNDTMPRITFDLGGVYAIDHMKLWNYNEYRPDLPARVLELLGRGVARTNISIAGADQVFTPLVSNHTFAVVTAATSNTDFSQTVNFDGVEARYVRIDILSNHNGKDFTNPASNDNLSNFAGLSEVQFFGVANPNVTEAPLGPTTHYFRKEFAFADDPSRTELFLQTAADDGAVYYLNGVEIYRHNMPGGATSYGTLASSAVGQPALVGPITVPAGSLMQGAGNVLAVEVHQSAASGDPDMLFGAELTALVSPITAEELEIDLALNEVSAGGDAGFFIELTNTGDAPINVGGYIVRSSAEVQHVLPASSIAPGAFLTVTAAQLGFIPAVGDRLYLLTPAGTILADAAELKTTLRGRSPDGAGEWMRPDAATPGSANVVTLNDDIVINEVMYHHRPTFATPGTPATYETTTLLPINSLWNYNRTGTNLGSNWYLTTYTPDGTTWRSGQGVIGVEPAALPAPILTTWSPYSGAIRTYYFQIQFDFAGLQPGTSLRMRHLIDDGAVFYLNGAEIPGTRFLMPTGTVDGTTAAAAPGVGDARFSDYIEISPFMLLAGQNTLSVEVHQFGTGSTDIVFGLELVTQRELTPPIPGSPFSENPEEWIELYNRSDETVDLSGWSFAAGVDYTFPANTALAAGQYLVVAKDAATLAAKYPSITIVGDYEGTLNDQDDRIELVDARGNTADEIHYYEGGRWPEFADGGGSSLELRNPDMDNTSPEAWAPSDESGRSSWQTITFRGVPGTSVVGPDAEWNELVLGLLDAGEVLLDDITVTQTPSGTPIQLIQNGTFEADAVGGPANRWRIVGNHQGTVIVDPTNAANKVLRLVTTGDTDHMSNHAETTLKNGATFVTISPTTEYEISMRAKWITGSPQLNSRLYFNRLARSTILSQPTLSGTPGAQNSTLVANAGPTYPEFRHSPAVPQALQPVTVSAVAEDPDGVASMTLWYAIAGGAWTSATMTHQGGGRYTGLIPGQAASTLVQFYVEGEDTLGAISTFPARGRNSRAMYKVNDNLAATNGLHNIRLVMTAADASVLHDPFNLMSNGRVPATVIYDENEIFYDVGVRLKGSEHSRVSTPRLGFNVEFNADQLFRGVHQTVSIDRSESVGFGQREMLIHQTMNHVGGILSKYNDLAQVISPLLIHTGSSELQMARYGNDFLDSQFENGSDGIMFEYELVYNITNTNDGTPEGRKIYTDGDGAGGVSLRNLGDDKENYRWTLLLKNNPDRDDYSRAIEWMKAMGTTGTAFTSQIGNFIDVDQWLRGFAFSVLSGAGDSYSAAGDAHNVQFYVRPEDNKVLHFPHDLDAFFDPNRPLVANGDLQKLMTVPANAHMYYGHVLDMLDTTYNGTYMAHWASNYGQLLPAQPFASHLAFIVQRSNKLRNDINAAAPQVPFNITSPDSTVNAPTASVSGTGWVNVRTIRKAGDPNPLPVTWNTVTGWTATVPVDFGTHTVTLEAYNFQGALIGSDTVTLTSTVSVRPLQDFLRITELMYHPGDLTEAEALAGFTNSDQFEYIELHNTSTDTTLNLAGVKFTDGVTFDFTGSMVTSLAPGQYAVVVADADAFEARYGSTGIAVAGTYTGQLNNAGETVRLEDPGTFTIQEFTYDDNGVGWHATTDGDGPSLVIINPLGDTDNWDFGTHWRPSFETGSPGGVDRSLGDFDLNDRVDATDLAYLQSRLGTASGATALTGDLTGDGAVDRHDVIEFARRFGRSNGPVAPSPVAPSPVAPSPVAPEAVIRRSESGGSSARAAMTLRASVERGRPRAANLAAPAVDQALTQVESVAPRRLRAYATRSVTTARDLGPDSPASGPSPK